MALEIRKIAAADVFQGKSMIDPIVQAAAQNVGQWLEFTHKSANMVGRLRKFGLEAQGRRDKDKGVSVIQYRLAEGTQLQTPPKVTKKAPGGKAKAKK